MVDSVQAVLEIPASEIEKRDKKYYVSFPPFPAVLMLPLVAVLHHRTNDVIFSVVLAGMVPALLYLLLRRLPKALASPTDPSSAARLVRQCSCRLRCCICSVCGRCGRLLVDCCAGHCS